MAKLLGLEHGRLTYLAADRIRRAARSYVMRSPFYQWRTNRFNPDAVLIVPQDLRTSDPSFALELSEGLFGLAGRVGHLHHGSSEFASPFQILPPDENWETELHGFSWLRHLGASEDPDASELAQLFLGDWMRGKWSYEHVAWKPAVVARRLMSWLTNSSLILDGADQSAYDELMNSFGQQMRYLAAIRHEAYPGYPRFLCLTAMVYGGLCLSDQEHYVDDYTKLLEEELGLQILEDGGHISRNSEVLIELILDLMPLKHCFFSRDKKPPEGLSRVLRKMCEHLRYMRLGDGTLGRFNGVGPVAPDSLGTALAYDESLETSDSETSAAHYCRLHREKTVLLMDVGAVPPLEFSATAHAGCLSFELSSGPSPIVVNCGAPGAADAKWRHRARSTAFHSTLELAGRSSSQLIRNTVLERNLGAPPIKEPRKVSYHVRDIGSSIFTEATHDGYASNYGAVHYRRLELNNKGTRLGGHDKLDMRRMSAKLRDIQYAIHFHIHPSVQVRRAKDRGSVALILASGDTWLFTAGDAPINLEESVFLADFSGAKQAVQIVLRGNCRDEVDVKWTFEQVENL